ncbi:MAG: methylated-DNA--[protein]-cysteine S-methyltransferase [Pseudomonadota bacterium]
MAGFALFDTPAGACGLAWNDALEVCGGQLPEATPALSRQRLQQRFPDLQEVAPPPGIADVIERLVAALQGAPDTLEDVPLADAEVPEFNRRVYALARRIPPGQTRSYGELAAELGGPGVARAVGQALGRNHFAPLVPCHRVLGAQHQAGGFSGPGGLKTKLRLLQLEGAKFGDQPGLF